MKDTRSDFKVGRNQKIFEEYAGTDTSFNKLAKKYDLSPQRVQMIVSDAKKKGLGRKLSSKSSKKDREQYKNRAVELRESGKLDFSMRMFDEVIAYDKENKNVCGLIDVMGHKRIVYSLMADTEKDKAKRSEYLKDAAETTLAALQIAKKTPKEFLNHIYILQIHLASVLIRQAESESGKKKQELLTKSLQLLNDSAKNIKGSKAHKAWPMEKIAGVQYLLGKKDDSVKTLNQALEHIYEGYDEEMNGSDQGRIKIKIWLNGILVRYAQICVSEKKPLLAEIYASSVMNCPDADKVLVSMKRDAKKVLESF